MKHLALRTLHIFLAVVLVGLSGCGKSADTDWWTVYEGDVPTYTAKGKPVVNGNSLSFTDLDGKSMTISGRFKFHEAKTKPCPFCQKPIVHDWTGCVWCKKEFQEPTIPGDEPTVICQFCKKPNAIDSPSCSSCGREMPQKRSPKGP